MTFLKKRNRRRFISYEKIDEEVSNTEIFERLTANNRRKRCISQRITGKIERCAPKISFNIELLLFYMKLKV